MFSQVLPEVTLSLFGLTFVEGLLAFLSPCILPLLPIYLMYLSGNERVAGSSGPLIRNTLGFIVGFTVVFVLLGATASGLGSLLSQYRVFFLRLSGVIVIMFGLNYLGVLNIRFLNRTRNVGAKTHDLTFGSSILFGAAFSFGWTPCLGAFLGTALLLASNTGTLYQGMGLLFMFSLGLGVPFFLTALLWNRLQGTLEFIKRNLHRIQMISGGLLVIVGLLMVFDLFGSYVRLFL